MIHAKNSRQQPRIQVKNAAEKFCKGVSKNVVNYALKEVQLKSADLREYDYDRKFREFRLGCSDQIYRLWKTTICFKTYQKHKRFRKIVRKTWTLLGSTIGLIVVMIMYTILGSFVIMTIESPQEIVEHAKLKLKRDITMEALWNVTQTMGSNETNWRVSTVHILDVYEKIIQESTRSGVDLTHNRWDFLGAVFFCITVYTTIGYGHIAPKTFYGRIFCMVYALLGIPLCLVVLAKVGEIFTKLIKTLWVWTQYHAQYWFCRSRLTPPAEQDGTSVIAAETGEVETNQRKESVAVQEEMGKKFTLRAIHSRMNIQFNLPISFAICLIVVYILAGAIIYRFWEQWSYFESFYFIFISISTIGFGDVMPQHPHFFIFVSVYIFVGLSLISVIIGLIMENLARKLDAAKRRLRRMGTALSKTDINQSKADDHNSVNHSNHGDEISLDESNDVVEQAGIQSTNDVEAV